MEILDNKLSYPQRDKRRHGIITGLYIKEIFNKLKRNLDIKNIPLEMRNSI